MKRRTLLKGCGVAAGMSVLPVAAWFNPFATGARTQNDVLVYCFLRGGIDGLHLLAPVSGAERTPYETRRQNMAIPEDRLRPLAGHWGLHPRVGGAAGDAIGTTPKWLHALYNQQRLAIIQGAGMPTVVNRSHFDAQAFMDLGTPGSKSTSQGWLARYLAAASGLPDPLLSSAFGFAGVQPMALMGDDSAFTLSNAQEFRLDGFHWSWNDTNPGIAGHQGAHHQLYPLWLGESSDLAQSGRLAAEALAYLREIEFRTFDPDDRPEGYQPEGGADYPSGTLGTQLRNLAQLIKLDTGLVAATVDFGGWDTHDGQGMPNPGNPTHYDYFGNRIEEFSRALHAFYTDLSQSAEGDFMQRVSVVVLSEFGRRVRLNASNGTDHGYGNVMMALGGKVQGGMHGEFPGLDDNSLFQGQDLSASVDYRQVLAEALVGRLGLSPSALGQVFPGLGSYAPIGIFQS
jgi:uncharacterized protein (DUF1501 family)